MQQVEVIVSVPSGLHARPAANLVQTAMGYKAQIFVEKGSRKVSAKSLVSILSLGVKGGERICVQADGVDESEALEAISQLAANHFGELGREG